MRNVGVTDCDRIRRRLGAARVARVALLLAVAAAAPAAARSAGPTSVAAMARAAAHVFRGRCTGVAVETADVGGVRLAVTAYTFRVSDRLKGAPRSTITFRQIGTPDGGARDLARLVGLPVYAPGSEYVLFLLPESRAGVTAPAGAAEGAFLVRDDAVASVGGPEPASTPSAARAGTTASSSGRDVPRSYKALRRAVLDELDR